MERLHSYADRMRYLRDPVVTLVIPLLVGVECLAFLNWRETGLGWTGLTPPFLFSLDSRWFGSEFGLSMQTFLLVFHPILVLLLWIRWRLRRRRMP